jgi:hypothetical protein
VGRFSKAEVLLLPSPIATMDSILASLSTQTLDAPDSTSKEEHDVCEKELEPQVSYSYPDFTIQNERDLATRVFSVDDDPSMNPYTFRAFFLGFGLSVFGGALGNY